jgi:hypothetical protein
MEDLANQIKAAGETVKTLKSEKAAKEEVSSNSKATALQRFVNALQHRTMRWRRSRLQLHLPTCHSSLLVQGSGRARRPPLRQSPILPAKCRHAVVVAQRKKSLSRAQYSTHVPHNRTTRVD